MTEHRINPTIFTKEEVFEAMLVHDGFKIKGYTEKRDYTDYFIEKDGVSMKYRFYLYIGALPAEVYYRRVKKQFAIKSRIVNLLRRKSSS